jgi:phage-related protein
MILTEQCTLGNRKVKPYFEVRTMTFEPRVAPQLAQVYQKWYDRISVNIPPEPELPQPILEVRFFQTNANNEPVRDWLKARHKDDRRSIGEDIKTAQFGWPLGMPLVRKLEKNLWEVRTNITDGIARVIFTVIGKQMVLLHAFVKKSQKTPKPDLETARKRLKLLEDA